MSRIYLPGKQIEVADVIDAVASLYNFTPEQMVQESRGRMQLAFARQLAMFIAYELCNKSQQQIGQEFGGRDHTTVIHARKIISSCLKKPRYESPKQEKDRIALANVINQVGETLNKNQ